MILELRDEQAAFLSDLLNRHLGDLRMEISHTDSSVFKEQLRGEKSLLLAILAQLSEAEEPHGVG